MIQKRASFRVLFIIFLQSLSKRCVLNTTNCNITMTSRLQKPEDYSVRASYVELYNEQLYDLLSGSEGSLRVYDSKEKVCLWFYSS